MKLNFDSPLDSYSLAAMARTEDTLTFLVGDLDIVGSKNAYKNILYGVRLIVEGKNRRLSDFSEISFVFDVWSLGSIMIEILSGFPLWLSLKSRVKTIDGRSIVNYGIFGVSGRDNGKILH